MLSVTRLPNFGALRMMKKPAFLLGAAMVVDAEAPELLSWDAARMKQASITMSRSRG
jgi:hypothetical protein